MKIGGRGGEEVEEGWCKKMVAEEEAVTVGAGLCQQRGEADCIIEEED